MRDKTLSLWRASPPVRTPTRDSDYLLRVKNTIGFILDINSRPNSFNLSPGQRNLLNIVLALDSPSPRQLEILNWAVKIHENSESIPIQYYLRGRVLLSLSLGAVASFIPPIAYVAYQFLSKGEALFRPAINDILLTAGIIGSAAFAIFGIGVGVKYHAKTKQMQNLGEGIRNLLSELKAKLESELGQPHSLPAFVEKKNLSSISSWWASKTPEQQVRIEDRAIKAIGTMFFLGIAATALPSAAKLLSLTFDSLSYGIAGIAMLSIIAYLYLRHGKRKN